VAFRGPLLFLRPEIYFVPTNDGGADCARRPKSEQALAVPLILAAARTTLRADRKGETPMARLDGKVAVITGAGTGIGRATARLLAREGAKVVVAELNADAGEQTAQLIVQAGGNAIAIKTDVPDPDSIQTTIARAEQHYGALHILHNNAGGSTMQDSDVTTAPLEEFWRVIKLDLFGTFLGCRFGVPAIVRSGGGSVINMASNLALMGIKGRDCYTAAKGGIAAITRSMAVEFAPKVRVNAIAPSATLTDRVRNLLDGNTELEKMTQSHLLGLIEPEDIANMALFLASDESAKVTGQIYPVDSGITIS
jgi:NAD(P)-dependent dehydrogenase (short-subunit alcohol dehydrogenase family)